MAWLFAAVAVAYGDVPLGSKSILLTAAGDVAGIASFDFEGDGDLDFATAGRGVHLWRDEGGTLVRTEVVARSFEDLTAIAAGDFDGDGLVDLAMSFSEDGPLRIGFGHSHEEFPTTVDDVFGRSGLQVVDVDQDGDLDLLGCRPEPTWWENRNGNATIWTRLEVGDDDCTEIAAADLDGDGDLDIAAYADALLAFNDFADLSVFENVGGGFAWVESVIDDPRSAEDLELADPDLDGDVDIMVLSVGPNLGSDLIVQYTNDGAGSFPSSLTLLDGNFSAAFAPRIAEGYLELFVLEDDGTVRSWTFESGIATESWAVAHVVAAPTDVILTSTLGVDGILVSGHGDRVALLSGVGRRRHGAVPERTTTRHRGIVRRVRSGHRPRGLPVRRHRRRRGP
jgi:hypothetical protein